MLLRWQNRWHKRRTFIFRELARIIAPVSNLAEVVYANWKNIDKMGVTLLKSCMLNIRNSLLLETEIQNFKEGSCMSGSVQTRSNVETSLLVTGEKFGEEIKKYGVSSTATKIIQNRTNEEDTGNQKKRKQ